MYQVNANGRGAGWASPHVSSCSACGEGARRGCAQSGGSEDGKAEAARTLWTLAVNDDNEVAIAEAGAIPALVELVRGGSEAGKEMARHAVEMQRLANQIGDLLHRGKGPAARAVQLQFEQQRGAMKAAVDNLLSVATNADVHTVALGHDARDPTLA